jgi:hypothetical protein
MRLSDQVCSLELAKRLKELGVKQKSMFCWFSVGNGSSYELDYNTYDYLYTEEYISAFTVAELINVLREYLDSDIFIPSNVDMVSFLGNKLYGILEARAKKN